MIDLNPAKWTWGQWKAGGRHVATYAAGLVTGAVALGFISQGQGTDLTGGISDVVDGATQLAKGIVTIAGILLPMYTTWRAAHSASPSEQVKNVVASASNGMKAEQRTELVQAVVNSGNTEQRKEVIAAVAEMPEVKGVVAQPAVAKSIPSEKVVSSPALLYPKA